jgi:arylsulfatase A-like enzyme
MLHLNVPHEPGIYDRDRGDFTLRPPRGDPYVHNLALADRTLGEIRAAVERAGLWEKTTIMVFGDHGRRAADYITVRDNRVPLMVKLAGQAEGVAVPGPVDLLKLHDLTLEILAGRITTADQVIAWLMRT